jgi:3-hydroxyisobutyrate dehydrogenase
MRVAVLGTGIMGAPIARHLASAGHEVRAWNRTLEKAEGLGAEVAGSPAEAAAGAEALVTMLADGPAVADATREALGELEDGAVWLQLSTVGMAWIRTLSDAAGDAGVALVDAPVLGTRKPAEDGKLVVLAAGPESARSAADELFPAFSVRSVWLAAEPGHATALKLVLNHWITNSMENIAETVALAEGLGVDPNSFLQAIEGGGMDMPYAHMKTAQIRSGNLEPSFALRMARKDVGLILDAAEEAGVDLGLAQVTRERFDRAIELGHGDEDMAAAFYGTTGSV